MNDPRTGAINQDTRKRRPNIVLILTDDQGWGDLSLTGNVNLSTPNIDRLAGQGALLESFFVQPICAPTRAELLTGRYFPRTGVHGVTRRAEYLNLDETTIGEVFKQAGYATGCFGKWHSGSAYPYHPNGRGFDEFFGYCCGHWGHYFDSVVEHNGEEALAPGFLTDCLAEKAMEFMENYRDRPFLCYVPFNIPHSPFQVPDRWFDKFKDRDLELHALKPESENVEMTRTVLAMCENIDWNVGRLAQKIDSLGLTSETIFVYFSDNGPNGDRWNGGMAGRKGSTDEGGVRSPCFITWRGTISGNTRVTRIAGAIDLMPTLADLAGIDVGAAKPLDGVSLKPLLLEEKADWPERLIFAYSPNTGFVSARSDRFRAGGNSGGLYNIQQDIGQHYNLAPTMPDIYEQYLNKIHDWREDVLKGVREHPPIPVGYPEFPGTYLNAQDGIPTGDITWSGHHPNCSYFINWNNTGDEISWDVVVKSSGIYEISVMYACKEGEQGSELELICGQRGVRGKIEEAFDPPEKTGHDRVKRKEAYEKAFKSLKLGTIALDEGRSNIRLCARSIVGERVCEVRTVKLTLMEVQP
jgi:arylsulfatase A-like enzyme